MCLITAGYEAHTSNKKQTHENHDNYIDGWRGISGAFGGMKKPQE